MEVVKSDSICVSQHYTTNILRFYFAKWSSTAVIVSFCSLGPFVVIITIEIHTIVIDTLFIINSPRISNGNDDKVELPTQLFQHLIIFPVFAYILHEVIGRKYRRLKISVPYFPTVSTANYDYFRSFTLVCCRLIKITRLKLVLVNR